MVRLVFSGWQPERSFPWESADAASVRWFLDCYLESEIEKLVHGYLSGPCRMRERSAAERAEIDRIAAEVRSAPDPPRAFRRWLAGAAARGELAV